MFFVFRFWDFILQKPSLSMAAPSHIILSLLFFSSTFFQVVFFSNPKIAKIPQGMGFGPQNRIPKRSKWPIVAHSFPCFPTTEAEDVETRGRSIYGEGSHRRGRSALAIGGGSSLEWGPANCYSYPWFWRFWGGWGVWSLLDVIWRHLKCFFGGVWVV